MTPPLTLLVCMLAAAADGGPAGPDSPADPAAKATPALDVRNMPFTPDSIAQVVRAHQTDIQDCYEKTLALRQQKLQGTLMTHFVITAAGTVTGAQVQKKGTTLKDKDLNACIEGVLSGLRFPKPPDAKSHPVEYPFNLHALD